MTLTTSSLKTARNFVAAIAFSWTPLAAGAGDEPPAVAGLILTWQRDPTTTITIDWHENVPLEKPVLLFRGRGDGGWKRVTPMEVDFPYLPERKIYRSELTGLKPGTTYEFRPHGRRKTYHFTTMPASLDRALRVVAGGDTAWGETFAKMNRRVAQLNPDLIVWGGDYSYSDGREELVQREIDWHANIRDHLIADDGRVIPVLAAIGNHEVRSVVAPYYHANFAFPGEVNYGVIDFGNYLSVWLLASNHITRIAGRQTEWLAATLSERAEDPSRVLLPIYHVPAYPGVRQVERTTTDIRNHWIPHFERAGVSFTFEHHDHAYKRSHPLLRGEIQNEPAKGITYLGDGAWGASTRKVRPESEIPELARALSVHHVFLFELSPAGPIKFQAVDVDGNVFDRFELPRRR